MFGLVALYDRLGWLEPTLRVVGAAYLIALGLRLLLRGREPSTDDGAPRGWEGLWGAFLTGMVTDLGNPKAAAFFTGLFASRLGRHPSPVDIAALVATIVVVAAAWYGVVAMTLGRRALRSRHQAAVQIASGSAVSAFGIVLAVEFAQDL